TSARLTHLCAGRQPRIQHRAPDPKLAVGVLDALRCSAEQAPGVEGTAGNLEFREHLGHGEEHIGSWAGPGHQAALPVAECSAPRASRARRLASVSAWPQWSLSATACRSRLLSGM